MDGDGGAEIGLAGDRDLAAVELGEPGDDGQPEAGALLFVDTAFELDVGADVGDVLGAHPAALVGDVDLGPGTVGESAHHHGVAGGGELEGVVDEFLDDLGEVGFRHGGLAALEIELEVEGAPRVLGFATGGFFHRAVDGDGGHLAQGAYSLGLDGHHLDLGVDQKVHDEAVQAHAGELDVVAELAQFGGGEAFRLVDDHLGHADDAGERSEQLVRQHHGDVAAQFGEPVLGLVADRLLFAQAGADDIDQFVETEGLRQVVVGAQRHAVAHALEVGATGHEDEGDVGCGLVGAQRGEGVVSVHPLHVDVADDEVGVDGAGQLHAADAVVGLEDLEVFRSEAEDDGFPKHGFVIDD